MGRGERTARPRITANSAGGPPRESAAEANRALVVPSLLNQYPSVGEAEKPVLLQAFVAQPSIEALDERVLHRLPSPDELQANTAPLRPGEQRAARELGAIVSDDGRR